MDVQQLAREFEVDFDARTARHRSGAVAEFVTVTDDSSHQLSVARVRDRERYDGSDDDFTHAALLAAKQAGLDA